MNAELLSALLKCETDINGAMNRFGGNEKLYVSCLDAFLRDRSLAELDAAIMARDWDEAFTAAHALKGLAGNMGFVPIFHTTAEIVILIRTGKIRDLGAPLSELQNQYGKLTLAIRRNCKQNTEGEGLCDE